ncbi:hypothetical protein GCM10027290_22090 [Micromonospora sonneratiae]
MAIRISIGAGALLWHPAPSSAVAAIKVVVAIRETVRSHCTWRGELRLTNSTLRRRLDSVSPVWLRSPAAAYRANGGNVPAGVGEMA